MHLARSFGFYGQGNHRVIAYMKVQRLRIQSIRHTDIETNGNQAFWPQVPVPPVPKNSLAAANNASFAGSKQPLCLLSLLLRVHLGFRAISPICIHQFQCPFSLSAREMRAQATKVARDKLTECTVSCIRPPSYCVSRPAAARIP